MSNQISDEIFITQRKKYTHKNIYKCEYVIIKGKRKGCKCDLNALHKFNIDGIEQARCGLHSPKRMMHMAYLSAKKYSQ